MRVQAHFLTQTQENDDGDDDIRSKLLFEPKTNHNQSLSLLLFYNNEIITSILNLQFITIIQFLKSMINQFYY